MTVKRQEIKHSLRAPAELFMNEKAEGSVSGYGASGDADGKSIRRNFYANH